MTNDEILTRLAKLDGWRDICMFNGKICGSREVSMVPIPYYIYHYDDIIPLLQRHSCWVSIPLKMTPMELCIELLKLKGLYETKKAENKEC